LYKSIYLNEARLLLLQHRYMKNFAFIFISYFVLTMALVSAQSKLKRTASEAPFQGTKHYCSEFKPVQYDVTIKGIKVLIIYTYKDFTKNVKGTFIKGKVFTDDPNETGSKGYKGRYYKISKDFLAINNLGGSDYVEYGFADRKMLPFQ